MNNEQQPISPPPSDEGPLADFGELMRDEFPGMSETLEILYKQRVGRAIVLSRKVTDNISHLIPLSNQEPSKLRVEIDHIGHMLPLNREETSHLLVFRNGVIVSIQSGENETAKKQYEHSHGKIIGQVDIGEVDVLDISLFNGDATMPTDVLEMHGSIRIGVRFEVSRDLPSTEIIIGIHTPDFIYVSMATSALAQGCPDFGRGVHYFECHLADVILKPGSYALRLGFFDQYNRLIWFGENLKSFRVGLSDIDLDKATYAGYLGLVDLPFSWHFFDSRSHGEN